MKPYYTTEDGQIRIFHARWEDVLAAGVFAPKDVALVHADPPYGIGYTAERKRGHPSTIRSSGGTYGKNWDRVAGDDTAFDPAPILEMDRPSVLWGANNYASRLPDSGGWLVWDKKRGGTIAQGHQGSDAELAWTNMGRCVDLFQYYWDGFRRDGEVGAHYHPTQKPEALCAWVFSHAIGRRRVKRGDLVLVPYMGSGPDLRPALAAGLRVIACEVAEEYCRTAVSARLGAMPAPLPASSLGPLFGR